MGRGTSTPTAAPQLRKLQKELLSRRETAMLADLSLKSVDKAIEQRVIQFKRAPGRQLFIPPTEVAVLAMIKRVEIKISTPMKRQIRDWTVSALAGKTAEREFSLAPVLVVRLDSAVEETWRQAFEYAKARQDYIESDPEVKGGEPVIRGTRLTATAVATRLARGDSMDDVAEDYPDIDRAALEAAAIYGSTHPRQGRPPRPPRPSEAAHR